MEPKIEVKWVDFECFNSFNCRLLGVTSGSKLPIGGKWNHLQWQVHDEWNQEWMRHQTWSPEVLFRTSDMFKLSQINQDHPFHTNNAKHGNTNMASSWKIIHPASTCLYGRKRQEATCCTACWMVGRSQNTRQGQMVVDGKIETKSQTIFWCNPPLCSWSMKNINACWSTSRLKIWWMMVNVQQPTSG